MFCPIKNSRLPLKVVYVPLSSITYIFFMALKSCLYFSLNNVSFSFCIITKKVGLYEIENCLCILCYSNRCRTSSMCFNLIWCYDSIFGAKWYKWKKYQDMYMICVKFFHMICYALNKENLMISHESFIFRTFVNEISCSIVIIFLCPVVSKKTCKPNFP